MQQAEQDKRESFYRTKGRTWRGGLRMRIAISYVGLTAGILLLLEALAVFGLVMLLFSVIIPFTSIQTVKQTAERYAYAAALQAHGTTLNPESTFLPHQANTLTLPGIAPADDLSIPYRAGRASGTLAVALLIAPDGQIIASSYPAGYPAAASAGSLLPRRASVLDAALDGRESSGIDPAKEENVVYAAVPIWSQEKQAMGAIYVQIPNRSAIQNVLQLPPGFLLLAGVSGLSTLLLLAPIGGFFGVLTMRGVIRRIRALESATAGFAEGDYSQRVKVYRSDELGQLEQHFNSMAEQLVESTRQQRQLSEQNARLAERSRMARDLHDSVKQQVFALATRIGTALVLLDTRPEEIREHLKIANELAYQARQELTALIQELRPVALSMKSFQQALRDELTRWSRQNGIAASEELATVPQLAKNQEEELLRVVQEALANVARHSQATQVRLTLTKEDQHVVLTIADNGRGFDPATLSGQGVGLPSMRERLEEIGGTLLVQSQPGKGTRIVASCPHPESSV